MQELGSFFDKLSFVLGKYMTTSNKNKKRESAVIEMRELPNDDVVAITSHAAKKCYQSQNPEYGVIIDVEKELFEPGHHTTLQHAASYLTYDIEKVAVGDVTFGLHLDHPFYNSDQRSGRYCAKMFEEPDFDMIKAYIQQFWPEVGKNDLEKVMQYVKKGVSLYHQNIDQAREISRKFLKEERPFINEKDFERNYPKIAQEQMRMFISVIFPTGLDYTINLTALAAMHRSAWTPPVRHMVSKMIEIALKKHPKAEFMFDPAAASKEDIFIPVPSLSKIGIKYKPEHSLRAVIGGDKFVIPRPKEMHPVDQLHFNPRLMNNNTGGILTQIELSVATMGQDQRHRMVRRSAPSFTGAFYLPPILKEMRLEKEASALMREWIMASRGIPGTLAMVLAPYGAMVTYEKLASFNALCHEQGKRLCWCAQEEIYHAGLLIRQDLPRYIGKKSELLQIFQPPCYSAGKCAELKRYCGRDLKLRKTGDYFPERKV